MDEKIALLIDDDKDLTGFVGMAIETLGYTVKTAHTGAVALQRLAELVPDLVILDMHLPDMLGVDILQRIRQDERLRHVPVAVLSGGTQPLSWNLHEHANLVLTKPIDAGTLTRLIDRISASGQ